MRVRPTELGLKGMALLALLEVAFLATAYSNLFFLLLVFCGVLGAFGLVAGIANARGVGIGALVIPFGPAFAPRSVRVELKSRRQRFDLQLLLDDGDGHIELPLVARITGSGVHDLEMPPLPRGLRRVRAVRVATRFPFGLFEVRANCRIEAEVVTYPGPSTHAARASCAGEHDPGASAVTSTGIAGVRPFRPGDALRDVHWKASARRTEPVVKEREHGAGDALELVVDRRCDEVALERALGAATGLAFAAKEGRGLRLASQGFTAQVVAGQPPTPALLRWLAEARPLPAHAEPPPARRGALALPNPQTETAHA
jgi:uncharacterized protein (DUF58 family)